jgi:hypothetical protein
MLSNTTERPKSDKTTKKRQTDIKTTKTPLSDKVTTRYFDHIKKHRSFVLSMRNDGLTVPAEKNNASPGEIAKALCHVSQ